MRPLVLAAVVATVVATMVFGVRAQNAAPQGAAPAGGQNAQQPAPGTRGRGAPGADPYANNAAPGTQTFPLAAKAGVDSNARMVAPPGAVNQGPFDPSTWKYGTAFDPPAGSKIWNPVKLKMLQGGR